MKKIKIITFFVALVLFIQNVNAASVSVTSSYSSIVKGGNVTFYVTVNAAGWNISGNSSGATSGCSLRELGDTGTGKSGTKTFSATCTATDIGQIGFTVTGDVADESGNTVKVSKGTSVSVVKPRDPDSNNDLSSLKVGSYPLSPQFNKDTLEYKVDLPNTVNKINIEASKLSNYSTISGTGEKEVNEGSNLFEISVTSETGITKTYKLIVNVKDDNPIKIKVNDKDYSIIKNAKNLTKPDSFTDALVTINNIEVPAFFNETLNITLVGIKDEVGNIYLAIYNKDKNTYELYTEIKSNQMVLLIKKIPEIKDNLIESKITIDKVEYPCLKTSENSEYAVVYATNIITGIDNYYLYDSKTNSFTRYNDEQLIPLKEELDKYKNLIIYLAGGLVFSFFIIMLLLIIRPKRKKEVRLESIKEEVKVANKPKKDGKNKTKDIKEPEEKTVKDTLEKIEDATKKIEEFESKKTNKDLEETMYDIFESDRKKKKKR